jgi:GDP-L-fucose synthase
MKLDGMFLILGASGLVGSAVHRKLLNLGVPVRKIHAPSSSELDLMSEASVAKWKHGYDYIINCAARVGGILDNQDNKYEFISANLKMQQNAMKLVSYITPQKYVFLGSSCIYPNNIKVPIREVDLMSGPLEHTNDAYAIAKIAGIHLGKAYFEKEPNKFTAIMPCNVYGPHDSFHSKSHVIPDLIQKFMNSAKYYTNAPVILYGTGNPLREFIYSDDLAEAIVLIATYTGDKDLSMVNVGTDFEISISDLAYKIKDKVGSKARIIFDNRFPDGTMRKKLDTSKMENVFGWKAKTNLDEGLTKAIEWYSTFKQTEKWTRYEVSRDAV